jgi:hypothetical protein
MKSFPNRDRNQSDAELSRNQKQCTTTDVGNNPTANDHVDIAAAAKEKSSKKEAQDEFEVILTDCCVKHAHVSLT